MQRRFTVFHDASIRWLCSSLLVTQEQEHPLARPVRNATNFLAPWMQHIQGIAIDAARSNVDHHYLYICDAYNSFMQTHTAQVCMHGLVSDV